MDIRIHDSPYQSLEEAIAGKEIPDYIREKLCLVDLTYLSFDGCLHAGHMVLHTEVADEVRWAFTKMLSMRFPIEKVIPVHAYDWSDDASMADNNSSAFNYRLKPEKDEPSEHSFGWALDINPVLNPFISRSNTVYPPGAVLDPSRPGTLTGNHPAVLLFKSMGWTWGGDWIEVKDYQHFERPIVT